MNRKQLNRRQVLKDSARIALGAAAAGWMGVRPIAAQMPRQETLNDDRLTFVVTTEASPWQNGSIFKPTFRWDMLNLNVDTTGAAQTGRPMDGFGACFNELGWTSLQQLAEGDRESILRELFDPASGARFTYCRTPIGANDFATDAYSYDETDGDFALKDFSIAHDENTLVPFIQAALRHQPKLKLWASPGRRRVG